MRRFTTSLLLIILLFTLVMGCDQPSADPRENVPPSSMPPSPQESTLVVTAAVLDVHREPDPGSELVTQALYNQPVEVKQYSGRWVQVRVVDGYLGWIDSGFIAPAAYKPQPAGENHRAVIQKKIQKVYADPDPVSVRDPDSPILEAMMGTEFTIVGQDAKGYRVALPGGRTGWLEADAVMVLTPEAAIPKTGIEEFIASLERFRGTPYLWGGVSSRGIDCSGLTYICARVNGVRLPRDADQQYGCGQPVEGGLQRGDLVFFRHGENSGPITHVGVYLGGDRFIHASGIEGMVTVSALGRGYYSRRLVGARRLF